MSNIPQEFLFRLRFPIRRADSALFSPRGGARVPAEALGANYRIPFWTQREAAEKFASNPRVPRASIPRSPENENRFDFRVGWAPEGLAFTVVVRGKRRFVRRSRAELNEADCVRLCLDLRDVKEARRAGRFCLKFLWYPLVGESDDVARPLVVQAPIARAKETAVAVDVAELRTATDARSDGCAASALFPASTLIGYDPLDFPRLGLHFSVRDDEFGAFDLQHSALFPVEDDPSLWPTLDFVE